MVGGGYRQTNGKHWNGILARNEFIQLLVITNFFA